MPKFGTIFLKKCSNKGKKITNHLFDKKSNKKGIRNKKNPFWGNWGKL